MSQVCSGHGIWIDGFRDEKERSEGLLSGVRLVEVRCAEDRRRFGVAHRQFGRFQLQRPLSPSGLTHGAHHTIRKALFAVLL